MCYFDTIDENRAPRGATSPQAERSSAYDFRRRLGRGSGASGLLNARRRLQHRQESRGRAGAGRLPGSAGSLRRPGTSTPAPAARRSNGSNRNTSCWASSRVRLLFSSSRRWTSCSSSRRRSTDSAAGAPARAARGGVREAHPHGTGQPPADDAGPPFVALRDRQREASRQVPAGLDGDPCAARRDVDDLDPFENPAGIAQHGRGDRC